LDNLCLRTQLPQGGTVGEARQRIVKKIGFPAGHSHKGESGKGDWGVLTLKH